MITTSVKTIFRQQGFVKLKNVVDLDLVLKVKNQLPKIFGGSFDTGQYPDEWHWRKGISNENVPREICNAWKCDRTIAGVVLSRHLGMVVSEFMDWENGCRIGQDDVIWKPPLSGPVNYHQDSQYISRQFVPYRDNSVTMWIALDETSEENGGVEYAVGSHKWKSTIHKGEPIGQSGDFHGSSKGSYRDNVLQYTNSDIEFQCPTLHPGDCLIHNQDTLHGSPPSMSKTLHRRALVIHYLKNGISFVSGEPLFGDINSSNYIYGRYKRLGSLELPEESFPIVYSPTGKESTWIPKFCTNNTTS